MIIEIPSSIGELVDKISILMIKQEKITDKKKLLLINEELSLLQKKLNEVAQKDNNDKGQIFSFLKKLKEINFELWEIEDKIRDCERKKNFGKDFIALARSVYITNDKRAELKKEINHIFDSTIYEVKSYQEY